MDAHQSSSSSVMLCVTVLGDRKRIGPGCGLVVGDGGGGGGGGGAGEGNGATKWRYKFGNLEL